MYIAAICDAFDWTYDQYMNEPKWLIELRLRKRAADSEMTGKQSKSRS